MNREINVQIIKKNKNTTCADFCQGSFFFCFWSKKLGPKIFRDSLRVEEGHALTVCEFQEKYFFTLCKKNHDRKHFFVSDRK